MDVCDYFFSNNLANIYINTHENSCYKNTNPDYDLKIYFYYVHEFV